MSAGVERVILMRSKDVYETTRLYGLNYEQNELRVRDIPSYVLFSGITHG